MEETIMKFEPGQTVYTVIPEGIYPYRFLEYDKYLPDEKCYLQRIDLKHKYKRYPRKLKDVYQSITDAQKAALLRKLS